MPDTRSQRGSRGGADRGTYESAGIAQSADNPASQSAADMIRDNSQGEMSGSVPTDLNDQQIVLLRARVMRARKDLDDITAEISEQVAVISTEQGRATPVETLWSYKKALKCLIDQGELQLTNVTDKNGSLVERLEMLVLTAPEGSELHTKATSLRDRLVGEAVPYRAGLGT